MANYIPLDILVNHIFIRLPIKSLLNCSCVCKLWLRTISDSEFRRIHVQHQTKQKPNHQKLLCGPLKYRYKSSFTKNDEFRNKEWECRGIFYSLDLESTPPALNRLPGFPAHRMNNFKLVKTLGYSNGMLCMEARIDSDWGWRYIFFGNPSTGYYKIIPDRLLVRPLVVGFGYDSHTDDYKLVWIDNTTRYPLIYSLNSNSWTINEHSRSDKLTSAVEERAYYQGYVSKGCFVDGSIYWYADGSIIIFDLKEEKFKEMDMPDDFIQGYILLTAVEGSICIIDRQSYCCGGDIDVDIWLLESEEEKKNNIVKKNYDLTGLLSLSNIRAENIYPLSFTKDGQVICSVEYEHEVKNTSHPASHYILVDPNTGSYKDIPVTGLNNGVFKEFIVKSYHSSYVDTFAETILSLC